MLAVCATPIGNLEDVTLRVLRELAEADVVLCEDTRHTAKLLERHGIQARLLSYHQHNEASRSAELVPRLLAGERMALVSDAGLPGVSDPGARLVAAALDAGVTVTVLPGASAVETALVASGLLAERYQFVGFLPREDAEIAALWAEVAAWPHAVVAFEAPLRLPATLRALAAAMPGRQVAVCRELTKRFEEIARGPAAEVATRFAKAPKGEIALVVGPLPRAEAKALASGAAESAAAEAQALEAVGRLVAAGTPRKVAAEVVGELTGVARKRLYDGSLAAGAPPA